MIWILSHTTGYQIFFVFSEGMATSYDPPEWAGKAAGGLHLDVLKVFAILNGSGTF